MEGIGRVLDLCHNLVVWLALLLSFPVLLASAYATAFHTLTPELTLGLMLTLPLCFAIATLDAVRAYPENAGGPLKRMRRGLSIGYVVCAVCFMSVLLLV